MAKSTGWKIDFTYLAWAFLIGLFFVFRSNPNFPVTFQEAEESYTAYSIIHTGRDTNDNLPGLLFRGDNNYLSTLGVYLRIPTIWLLGLNTTAVRIPTVVLGGLAVYAVFLSSLLILKSRLQATIVSLVFSLSPFFIQLSLFNLGLIGAVAFSLLASYMLFTQRWYSAVFLSFLGVLSDFSSIPFLTCLFVGESYVRKGKKVSLSVLVASLTAIVVFLLIDPRLIGFFKRTTTYREVQPQNFTYLVDQRLSFGQLYSSPLITEKFNFNRIAHNKIFYRANALSQSLIGNFNYEKLTSSSQAGTILSKETVDSKSLPRFFFWEIPFILLAVIVLAKRLPKQHKLLVVSALATVVIFSKETLVYLLPFLALGYTILLTYLWQIRFFLRPALISLGLLFLVITYASFYDLLNYHQEKWLPENDFRQYQIWNTITNQDINEKKVIVTDRLGEPAYYYLYYKKVDPNVFREGKALSTNSSSGIQRVNRVGGVEFKSFKYFESPRGKDEVWVGMGGEFLGENQKFKDVSNVTDGVVFQKILGVNQANKFLGDQLWFVKTTLQ
ncbi:MAG: hypothetical protein A2782_02850 [Candidatus Blackburnbacteria bacterium RIFCSPHIGHO2_01_FULL_43_15b]|uniref:Glycosyltransferase RgtA/B/C/D-like domain-containing protein n=1 Tax=Candidatus Blackburnbacteria bacterium RIFCSPHIGHO2_01_FULL_43_15b TaxID=1797513 RepID=A0A1G1V2Z2_9BACT|nr:MAG: hypothetical protein A2782_02850 [Candidatus Blackburnbacteria bacterium RIFCSPHIGHO2_01_FULL_43_15b]